MKTSKIMLKLKIKVYILRFLVVYIEYERLV